jgi:glutaryl-CoA dehydrogenase
LPNAVIAQARSIFSKCGRVSGRQLEAQVTSVWGTLERHPPTRGVTVAESAGSEIRRSASDLMNIDDEFSADELDVRESVREFVDRRIRPNIARWFDDAVFPTELVPEMAELGLLGMHLHGYGCAGRSSVEYGLAMQELEAGDSGIRTFVSVQGSLAMSAISKHGSERQKQEWLPRMARGEAIGCFGLTEPTAGSDPSSMATVARLEGGEWVLGGAKRWIGLASIADVAVIWARTDEGVRGFLVPTSTPGFTATPIAQKLSMRASIQCDIDLVDVRLPEDAVLPGAIGLGGPFSCLNEARYGIAWGAVGAARDSFDQALAYALERRQFDKPLAGFQLTQLKLVNWALEIQKAQLLALRLGRLKDAGTLEPHMISVAKLNNTRIAIEIARDARTVLGGNGITLDYSPLRHANNLESVRTYEGTDEVHTLILGQRITGISAFRG